ncbi:MAG: hypothetical protein ACKO3T_28205 [Planctomycetaceae bacterium]
MIRNPQIFQTRRFEKAYRKSCARLQGLIDGTVHDVVNRARSMPFLVSMNFDRHALLPGVLEVDVTGSHRMLCQWADSILHLLDVGDHEVVPRYTKSKFMIDSCDRREVSEVFWPEMPSSGFRFFSSNPEQDQVFLEQELSSEWLFYLSDQQEDVLLEIASLMIDAVEANKSVPPVCLLGGPGTGKTCVLLNLLKELVDANIDARICLSSAMQRFVKAWWPEFDLARCLTTEFAAHKGQIVLVDDPSDAELVRHWLRLAGQGKGVLLGFDPCQLSGFSSADKTSGITDAEFRGMCEMYGVRVFGLESCYRQKRNVGQAARKMMDVIAQSTPFLKREKIQQFRQEHEGLTELSNDLTFPAPAGYTKTNHPTALADLEFELRRIAGGPRWWHWDPLLIVVDPETAVPEAAWELVERYDIAFQTCSIRQVEQIKGLEFQHVFLFLGEKLFHQLESGFGGSGQAEYAARRLIRIPVSRAKDSLVTFVF